MAGRSVLLSFHRWSFHRRKEPDVSTIKLRVNDFTELAESMGHTTYEQQAAATGLGAGTLHRLRNGQPASANAVAAICSAYGVEFADLFAIGEVQVQTPRAAVA